jgi:hypothetical protein
MNSIVQVLIYYSNSVGQENVDPLPTVYGSYPSWFFSSLINISRSKLFKIVKYLEEVFTLNSCVLL